MGVTPITGIYSLTLHHLLATSDNFHDKKIIVCLLVSFNSTQCFVLNGVLKDGALFYMGIFTTLNEIGTKTIIEQSTDVSLQMLPVKETSVRVLYVVRLSTDPQFCLEFVESQAKY